MLNDEKMKNAFWNQSNYSLQFYLNSKELHVPVITQEKGQFKSS